MNGPFANQVAVVVGAASGIGQATADLFAGRGASVCRLDKTIIATDAASNQEIDPQHCFEVDATDFNHLTEVAANIHNKLGSIDHVVASVGMCSGVFGFPFWNVAPSLWPQTINVNLLAPVNVANAFVPHMLTKRRGTLCFVASVAGQIGSQTDPPYSAAKAGLINFTQCAAKDLAPYSIRANAVSPGMVKTPMNRQVWQAWREASEENTLDYDDWAELKIKQVSPLGRWQTNRDIAEAICFLSTEQAKNITGQTVNVDGGQVMHS